MFISIKLMHGHVLKVWHLFLQIYSSYSQTDVERHDQLECENPSEFAIHSCQSLNTCQSEKSTKQI